MNIKDEFTENLVRKIKENARLSLIKTRYLGREGEELIPEVLKDAQGNIIDDNRFDKEGDDTFVYLKDEPVIALDFRFFPSHLEEYLDDAKFRRGIHQHLDRLSPSVFGNIRETSISPTPSHRDKDQLEDSLGSGTLSWSYLNASDLDPEETMIVPSPKGEKRQLVVKEEEGETEKEKELWGEESGNIPIGIMERILRTKRFQELETLRTEESGYLVRWYKYLVSYAFSTEYETPQGQYRTLSHIVGEKIVSHEEDQTELVVAKQLLRKIIEEAIFNSIPNESSLPEQKRRNVALQIATLCVPLGMEEIASPMESGTIVEEGQQIETFRHRESLKSSLTIEREQKTIEISLEEFLNSLPHGSQSKEVFGRPLQETMAIYRMNHPFFKLIEHLRNNGGLDTQGLLRISGNHTKMKELKQKIQEEPNPDFNQYSLHDIAGVLKCYLRELPEPLLTLSAYKSFLETADLEEDVKIEQLSHIVKTLPELNKRIARHLMSLLGEIEEHKDNSQMSATNIAVCISTNILNGGRDEDVSSQFQNMQRIVDIVTNMVLFKEKIFD